MKKPYLDIFSGMLVEDRAKEITVQGVETYPELQHKPSVNGVTLSGDKTSEELYLAPASLVDTVQTHYTELTEDINTLVDTVEDNKTSAENAISQANNRITEESANLQAIIEENVATLEADMDALEDRIDTVQDGSITKIDLEPQNDLAIKVIYGDEESEVVALPHSHSEYLTSQDINGKADINLNNVASTKDFVVESMTYSNGGGYRLWRNGYCEQWGIENTTNSITKIGLFKAYKNTLYNIQVTLRDLGNFYVCAYPNTTSSINVRTANMSGTTAPAPIGWYVSGYVR